MTKIEYNSETRTFALKNKAVFDKQGNIHYDEGNFQSVWHKNKRYKDLSESEARKLYEKVLKGADSVYRSRNTHPVDSEGNLIYEKVNRGGNTTVAMRNDGLLNDDYYKRNMDSFKKQRDIAGQYRYRMSKYDPSYEVLRNYFGNYIPEDQLSELSDYYDTEGKDFKHDIRMAKNLHYDKDEASADWSDRLNKMAYRPFKIVKVDGYNVPYYMSSGDGGKTDVPTKKWYPFFGINGGWINKTKGPEINKSYDVPVLKYIKSELDKLYPYNKEFINDKPDPSKYKYDDKSKHSGLSNEAKYVINEDMDPVGIDIETGGTDGDLRKNINQFKDKIYSNENSI